MSGSRPRIGAVTTVAGAVAIACAFGVCLQAQATPADRGDTRRSQVGDGRRQPTAAAETMAALRAEARRAYDAGRYDRSARLYRRALQATAAGDAAARDAMLEDLGEALRQADHYVESARMLERARAGYVRRLGPDALPVARVCQRLASVRLQQQLFAAARADLDEATRILSRLPDGSLVRAAVFDTLGDLAWFASRTAEAERWYARAVEEAERAGGANQLAVALSLRNRSFALSALGRGDEAWTLSLQALERARAHLPAGHPERAWYANDAAFVAWYRGDYSSARRHWEAALAVTESVFGRTHLRNATLLNNLAVLARHYGDPDTGIALGQRALAIWRRALGPTHAYVARALGELAAAHLAAGRHEAARGAFTTALAIRERALGPHHRDVVRTRLELARLALRGHRRETARRHVDLAERAWRAGDDTDADATTMELRAARGELALAEGDLAGARSALEDAERLAVAGFDPQHPFVAQVRTSLADVQFRLGDLAQATLLAASAEHVAREHLRVAMRDLSERLALSYAETRPHALDVLVSAVALGGAEAGIDTALTAVVRGRGLVFDELIARRRPAADLDPDTQRLEGALAAARSRWANLAVRGPGEMTADRYDAALRGARDARDRAEQALAERHAGARGGPVGEELDAEGLRRALPGDAAVVSFVRYRSLGRPASPAAGSRPTPPMPPTPSYAAIVSRATGPAVLVTLGGAAGIERLVGRWREEANAGLSAPGRSVAEAERAYRVVGDALRRRIWDPIVPHVAGAARVLIVPDGALNVVSFAALPVEGGRFLVEGGQRLHYLATERDVRAPATAATGTGLLAFGGIAFGAAPPSASDTRPASARAAAQPSGLADCVSPDLVRFAPLPETAREVRDVAAVWTRVHGAAGVLSGAAASERELRRRAPAIRVLHLATHGFFFDGRCRTDAAGRRGVGGVRPAAPGRARPRNPLVLSGLALADANRRARWATGENDGILTAEEVASLDLRGVEWAVLSACDTGVGPVRVGEGVLGLRRAFQVAGARTVVMSLWSVEDRSASLWMRELYRGRLLEGRATDHAVAGAMLSVLRDRRAHRASTHPFFWGGFVAVGDWR